MTASRLVRVLRLRWRSVTGAPAVDAELDRELAFHLDQLVREHVAAGLDPIAATREARRALGSLASARESARDARRVGWLHDLVQDVRYAAGQLRRTPVFTAATVASLALAIGLNAAALAAIVALLYRPFPLPQADRLVVFRARSPVDGRPHDQSSLLELRTWQAQTHGFDALAGAFGGERDVMADDQGRPAIRIDTRAVTPGWFDTLGVRPSAGRFFTAEEYAWQAPDDVVVISDELWRSRYARDAHVLGRRLRVNGVDTRIVGVMPADLPYQPATVRAWFPLRLNPSQPPAPTRVFPVIARLRPGVSATDAQADIDAASRTIADRLPVALGWQSTIVPIREAERGWLRRPLVAIEGVAALMLLVAGANVTGLLLARNAARRHEFAMRAALGATRGRLARQMFGESLLLASAAGPFAIGVATGALRLLPAVVVPIVGSSRFATGDVSATLAALIAALVVTVALGVGGVPAVVAARAARDRTPATRATRRRAPTASLRASTIAVQFACASVLLVGAALAGLGLLRLLHPDLHLDTRRLASFSTRAGGVSPSATLQRLYTTLSHLADADAIAGISDWPLATLIMPKVSIRRTDAPDAPDAPRTCAYALVTPGYFRALRTPILAGREFAAGDGGAAPWAVVVNQAAASQLWPGTSPIGRTLLISGDDERPRAVIGVVADVPVHRGDLTATPIAYTSYLQQPPYHAPAIGVGIAGRMTFLIRYRGTADAIGEAARRAAAGAVPDAPLVFRGEVDALTPPMQQLRNSVDLLGCLAAIAAALAVMGLCGATALTAVERTPEIAVRIALGGRPAATAWAAVRPLFLASSVGLLAGVAVALVTPRFLRIPLLRADTLTPVFASSAVVALALAAAGGMWIGLRRSLASPPAEALRME